MKTKANNNNNCAISQFFSCLIVTFILGLAFVARHICSRCHSKPEKNNNE